MIKKMFLYLLFFLLFNIKAYAYHYDYTHTSIENFLYKSSDNLDKFISGKEYEVPQKTLVSGELSYIHISEQSEDAYNNLNFKVRFLFPRLRKHYKLVFENYKQTNSIDDIKEEDSSYMLAIAKGKTRLGVKFRGIHPDLFASYKLYYDKDLNNDWNFYTENRIIYFLDHKLDNTFKIIFNRKIDDNTNFAFNNTYQFQEYYNNRDHITSSLDLYHSLDYKSTIHYSLASYFQENTNAPYTVDYYTGASYRRFYYKNLNYYQIDTGFTFREKNDYEAKARVMIKFGILFGKSKKALHKD